MTREQAIKLLLAKIKQDTIFEAAAKLAEKQQKNYALKLLIFCFKNTDTENNWFTALAVLCINQRFFAGELLQAAYILSGGKILNMAERRRLIDAIESGAKITKADAGRDA